MEIKLRCILLDDELPGLTYLKMLCEQIPELEIVKAFNNPETMLGELSKLDFDLCILDVEMPHINGLQIANLLNGKMVIYTTAYKEYASEAFDVDAVDYIRKPVQKERLQQAVQKAMKRLNHENIAKPFIQLNTDKGRALIYFNQLAYLRTSETESRDKIAMLHNGTVLTLKNITFDALLEVLPPDEFCRINKGEVIALKVVQVFSFDEITTNISNTFGKPISFVLGEPYRADFFKKVNR